MKNPHGQELLPAKLLAQLPALYAQEGQGEEAIAYVKYFGGHFTWYGTEYDPETQIFFGKVYSQMEPEGELGYFSLPELAALKVGLVVVERDTSFKPTALNNCQNPCSV